MKFRNNQPWHLSYWSQTWQLLSKPGKKKFTWLVIIHFSLSLLFILKQGVLFDEPDYHTYAYHWAKGEPMRSKPIMDSKTPVVAISLAPVIIKPLLPKSLLENDIFFYLKLGRPFMYIFQLLGMYTMFCWLYRKFGERKWLVPLLFFCFDPLIFSYGMILGTDLTSASLLVTLTYTAWRFVNTSNRKYWVILSVATALAVVTKASMLYCYPLLFLLLLASFKKVKGRAIVKVRGVIIFIAIQWVVINACFYFTGTFNGLGSYAFESRTFQHLQSSLSFLSSFPTLLPAPFIQGIDMLQHHAEIGGCLPESTYRGVSLFNNVWCDQSVWFYYLVTAFFKFPLLIWLFIIAAVIIFILAGSKKKILEQELFVWLPFLYFLFLLSITNRFQIGIRHGMIMMPFLYIGLSSTINRFYYEKRKLFYGLLILHVTSIAMYIPNLLAYTNELIWNKTNAYHIMRDSSLDYGQARPWIKNYINLNPQFKQPTNIPDTGSFIIAVGDLYAEYEGSEKNIEWLRNNFNATGNFRTSILLFVVTDKDLRDKGLR